MAGTDVARGKTYFDKKGLLQQEASSKKKWASHVKRTPPTHSMELGKFEQIKDEDTKPKPLSKRVDRRNKCAGGAGRVRPRKGFDKRSRSHGGPGRRDTRKRTNDRFVRWAFGKRTNTPIESQAELEWEAEAIVGDLDPHTKVAVMDLVDSDDDQGMWWMGYFELAVKKDLKWLQSIGHQKFDFCEPCPDTGEEMRAFLHTRGKKVGCWDKENPVNATGEQYRIILYKRDIAAGHTDQQLLEKHKSCFVRYAPLRERMRNAMAGGRVLTEEEIQGRWSESWGEK